MKNRFTRSILAAVTAVSMLLTLFPTFGFPALAGGMTPTVWDGSVASNFAGGTGTENDPYLIATAEQLFLMADKVNNENANFGRKYYKLTADIVLNTGDLSGWDGSATHTWREWTAIGDNYNNRFRGTFDGDGHTVSGIYINKHSDNYQGLFGYITSGTVKNVGVVNSYIYGYNQVGGVCGYNDRGTIQNCYNAGTVSGNAEVGGVCGSLMWGSLSNCYSIGVVSGTGINIGGMCGISSESTFQNCYYLEDKIYDDYGDPTSGNDIGESKSASYMKSADFVTALGSAYIQSFDNLNDGYPLLKAFYFPSGDGSAEDPYHIGTAEQLRYVSRLVNSQNTIYGDKHYKLTADIILNDTTNWENWGTTAPANVWTPIGMGAEFSGTFDGDGHTVSGVYINSSDGVIGFFGKTANNAIIKNLGIESSYIKGKDFTGGIVGYHYGTVESCCNTAAVVANGPFVGGIVGANDGTIRSCYNKGSVSSTGDNVGGISGNNYGPNGAKIEYCYNTGTISGAGNIGGVCGFNENGTITNCYYLNTCGAVGEGQGKSEAEMKTASFIAALGSAFIPSYLGENGGYPVLVEFYPCEGDGTVNNPYLIGNPMQLYWMSYKVNNDNANYGNKYYKLTADIALNDTANWENWDTAAPSNVWSPIGTMSNPFKGTFDGNGKTVSGIYISRTTYLGLFGYADGRSILNVSVAESYIKGTRFVGGVCGYSGSGTIQNCYNTGTISGINNIGGICGANYGPVVSNCCNSGTIIGSSEVGGVCGYNEGSVSNSSNSGAVNGTHQVGGVCGRSIGMKPVINCYNTGTVSRGTVDTGGICGYSMSPIENCYNAGTINGIERVGGVCGKSAYEIKNCYNIGKVNGTTAIGSVCGLYSGTSNISNCYYLTGITGAGGAGEGKTPAEFASGEVAYLLNGGATQTNPPVWYQNLRGTKIDPLPVLDNTHHTVKKDAARYYNEHSFSGGACTVCGIAIVVEINGISYEATSLEAAITASGVALGGLNSIKVTAGYVTEADWAYIKSNKATLNHRLERITVTNEVTEVSDIPGELLGSKDFLNDIFEFVSIAKTSSLSDYAFMSDGNLAEAVFPAVTYIGRSAFSDCLNLTALSLPANPPTVVTGAFDGCPSTCYLTLVSADGMPLTGQALNDAITAYEAHAGYDSATGKWYGWILPERQSFVATVEHKGSTTGYYTFADAWTYATVTLDTSGNAATVMLFADVDRSNHFTGANFKPIVIPAGTKIVLDLNGKTIDRGLTMAEVNGNVISVRGTLFLVDSDGNGVITGGYSTGLGGGVNVSNKGELNMTGGNIKGNTSNGYGGGVRITSTGVFNMTGGKISGNYDNGYGGGGVSAEGSFNMSGGEISGNSTGSYGGGVDLCGSFTVSGTAKITGNVKNGTLDPDSGIYIGGTANNVYIRSGRYSVNIGTGGLQTGASIGVTTQTAPTADSPVNITAACGADYSEYFFSDAGYVVRNSGSGDAQVLTVGLPTVTLNATTGVSGFEYSTDGSTWETYTSPVPVTPGGNLWIKAMPKTDYHFIKWADGITTNPCQIQSITEDISYTPETIFVKVNDNGTADTADDYYEISNAEQLYWFAAQVNGGRTGINGKLTENITLNDGDLSGWDGTGTPTWREWTPIGKGVGTTFNGTFDGDGYTVSGIYINNDNDYQGLFGYSGGTIKNVGVVNSYIAGRDYIGGVCAVNSGTITGCYFAGVVHGNAVVSGVCGHNKDGGEILRCYNTGKVSSDTNSTGSVGGVCGYNTANSTIISCYNTGDVSGSNFIGGICGYSNRSAEITNCYYLAQADLQGIGFISGTIVNEATVKSPLQFSSGEVAYLLNGGNSDGVWRQTFGTGGDTAPVLDATHGKVYLIYTRYDTEGFGILGYANTASQLDKYQPATLVNGWYEISNAGQLFWMADRVNNDNDNYGNKRYKLTANIVLNKGELTADASGNPLYNNSPVGEGNMPESWYPIGYYYDTDNDGEEEDVYFEGSFNGNGFTVSGLFFDNAGQGYVGLFGQGSSAVISNVGVVNSYIRGHRTVGGVCGFNGYRSTITGCYNAGYVRGNSLVGGVCGNNGGSITNCYNTASVSGSDEKVGGVCGYNYSGNTITGCYNTGDVRGSSLVGGVCGENKGSITGCYYLENETNIPGIGDNSGEGEATVKSSTQFASGEVAWLLNGSKSDGELVWFQTIGTDPSPRFTGEVVYYNASRTDPYYNEYISVTITWTAMEFTYAQGEWNPDTLSYDEGGWEQSSNTVTVENQSNITVTAGFAFTPLGGYPNISGSFYKSDKTAVTSVILVQKQKETVTVALAGDPDKSWSGTKVGTITVTIGN